MTEAPKKEQDQGPEVAPHHNGLEVRNFPSDLEAYAVHNPHPTAEQWAQWYGAGDKDRVPPKSILGLHRRTFWFIVVLAMVVVGAAVGGGVGGSLAVQNARSKSETSRPNVEQAPAPTESATKTVPLSESASGAVATYTPPAASAVGLVSFACSSRSPNIVSWGGKNVYRCQNSTNILGGDITGIVAYSLQNCIDACATMNAFSGTRKCIGIVMENNLGYAYQYNWGANCWLKSSVPTVADDGHSSTARLCTSNECIDVYDDTDE